MPSPASFESFEKELGRLVAKFEKEHSGVTSPGYTEAQVRQDYVDPLILSLGWDLGNTRAMVQREREVEIESRTDIAGRQKRADYLFRTGGADRFVCEAKKPREELGPKYAFQARRYAWNKGLALATLTDFEELKLYIVGGKPHIDDGDAGLYKHYHFKQFPIVARELFDLLSRDAIAAGSIDRLLESLPKRPTGKGKARQLYLIKPDRTRSLDSDFLEFLDEARRDLASDLLKCNDRDEILEGTRLNEATQHILDRILFLRICEDRDIDTGTRLQAIVETWQRSYGRTGAHKPPQHELLVAEENATYLGKLPKESLCAAIVRHFKALDRRPPSHVPFFNGNLFKPHFSEHFLVSDQWLQDFIGELSDDASPYLFNVKPVCFVPNTSLAS